MIIHQIKEHLVTTKYSGFTLNFGLIRLNFAGGSR